MLCSRRGQSILEYSLLIAAVVAALLVTQAYVKRAYQGKLKESSDELGKQFQPSENYVVGWSNQGAGTTTTVESTTGGASGAGSSTTNIQQSETVTSSESEEWGTKPAAPSFTY